MKSDALDAQLMSLGRLSFLASHCSLHKHFPAEALSRLFVPAINHKCVRFFENEDKQVTAALIWARLSDEVSERMVFDRTPPSEKDWASGHNLWFLDILAPFDHGLVIARHLARNPPPEPFYFARLGKTGNVRKVVRGDAAAKGRGQVRSFFLNADGARVA